MFARLNCEVAVPDAPAWVDQPQVRQAVIDFREGDSDTTENGEPPLDTIELPIDGVLDLHTFAPCDVADVVATYLDECWTRGILSVRVIHGKGVGVQRRIVEGVLRNHPGVVSFSTAASWAGGWGATVVELRGESELRRYLQPLNGHGPSPEQ